MCEFLINDGGGYVNFKLNNEANTQNGNFKFEVNGKHSVPTTRRGLNQIRNLGG